MSFYLSILAVEHMTKHRLRIDFATCVCICLDCENESQYCENGEIEIKMNVCCQHINISHQMVTLSK